MWWFEHVCHMVRSDACPMHGMIKYSIVIGYTIYTEHLAVTLIWHFGDVD